jgi:antitoxin component HigA of HigAB toxin-antitoxin module
MIDIDSILAEQSSQRQPTLTTIVGMQGVGKTYYIISELIRVFLQTQGVLIYDYSAEIKYKSIPLILLKDLHKWKSKGLYRIYDPDPVKVFSHIRANVRNCCLILEDARSYMNSNLQNEITEVLGIRRQLGLDIVANFWALEDVPPKVFTYSNYITIFKTRDKLNKIEGLEKIPNLSDVIKVWKKVQNHPSKHYKQTISTT